MSSGCGMLWMQASPRRGAAVLSLLSLLRSTSVVQTAAGGYKSADGRGRTATGVTLIDVMKPGLASADCSEPPCLYHAFRIPGLVAVPPHSLLAFAEGRKTGCGDFDGQHDLVMRRSTDDGTTWGPLRTLVDAVCAPPQQQQARGDGPGGAAPDSSESAKRKRCDGQAHPSSGGAQGGPPGLAEYAGQAGEGQAQQGQDQDTSADQTRRARQRAPQEDNRKKGATHQDKSVPVSTHKRHLASLEERAVVFNVR